MEIGKCFLFLIVLVEVLGFVVFWFCLLFCFLVIFLHFGLSVCNKNMTTWGSFNIIIIIIIIIITINIKINIIIN